MKTDEEIAHEVGEQHTFRWTTVRVIKALKIQREEILKEINKIAKKLWDDVIKEKVEVDDCLEPTSIFIDRLEKKLVESEKE